MRQGLTHNIESIIEQVAQLECIKPYLLCGGTALAMQIGHRKSEDLYFMMWRTSRTQKPEVDWNAIERELTEKIGTIDNFNMLGFDQVEFLVRGVKFSFFVSDNYSPVTAPIDYMGNIRLADAVSIMAMKMEVMMRRSNFRDYYDIYSILQAGIPIQELISLALTYSGHRLKTKNLLAMLTNGSRFNRDAHFEQLMPVYQLTALEIENYIKNILTP